MQQYKVKALNVAGKGRKIHKSGDLVTAEMFTPGSIERLVHLGFIVPYEPEPLPKVEPLPINEEKKLTVAIVSAVWKRPEVFELFAQGIKHLQKNSNIDLPVFIAGSEGEKSKRMVRRHGFNYIEIKNDPLASKVNAPVQLAKTINPDYVLCLGSDDIISPGLMKEYEKEMRKGFDFIGVTDFYFYDTVTKKSSYWGGYRDPRRVGHTCGAGRLISKRLLDLWNWTPWETKDSKVLDNSMQTKLKNTPHSISTFSIKDRGVFGLDIKSSTNMTPFDLWDNTKYIDTSIIKKQFPFICAE
jgi:hypothetical protein